MKRDWLPLLLIPVLAAVALPLTGSPSSWVTLTVAGLAMGLMIFVMASGLTLTSVSPATARRSILFRTRDVHGQSASLKFFVVKHLDGLVRLFGRGIFDERKAAGLAGEFIEHQVH